MSVERQAHLGQAGDGRRSGENFTMAGLENPMAGSYISSPGDSEGDRPLSPGVDDNVEDVLQFHSAVAESPMDEISPMADASAYGWSGNANIRSRGSSAGPPNGSHGGTYTQSPMNGATPARSTRPTAARTPSNTYAPARRPNQFSLNTTTSNRRRASSLTKSRRNPNAEYRAQERAYVERIRQDVPADVDTFDVESRTPSLGYSTESETDDDSPSTAEYMDNDPHDQETLLYYGNDEMEPSVEELKIPENRERLEWHSMLSSVLTGDVVKQEKKRLIGGAEQQGDNSLKTEVWMGVRAKVCGRPLAAQRRLVEDGRSRLKSIIEAIITFEIKGEAEVGQTALEQVEDIVKKIEKCESLYPTRQALEASHPRTASETYRESCDAVISWHNTTVLINTELAVLRSWVGNDELDFLKPRSRTSSDTQLSDESTFIDRILKEDGLKSLQGERSLLVGVDSIIEKAKSTLIENADAFAERHLPPYMEELLTLINFPSRLIQDIIKVRLSYAKKMKDPAQQGGMMAEQMISQFQILLKLAVHIKDAYVQISDPEPGWDLPPCIDENFDSVVLEALRFYFKMLDRKLLANKNTFKEAEILEQEWGFSKELGRHLEGGDVEVAEQFR